MGITNDGQSLERTKCGSEFLITLALKSIAGVSFDCIDIILYRFPASRLSCYVFCTCLLTYNWKISWVERLICQNKWVGKAGWSELKSQNGEILKLPKKICSSLAAIHFVKVAPKKLICFEVLKIQYIHISWGTRCLDILKLCQSPFSVHFSPKRQMCLQCEIFHGRFGKIRNIKSNVPLIEK